MDPTTEQLTTEQAKAALQSDRLRREQEFQTILEREGRRLNCVIQPWIEVTHDGRIVSHVRIVGRIE